MKESFREEAFRSLFPKELQNVSTVSQSFQRYFFHIETHLKTIYGSRADSSKSMQAYFDNVEYKRLCTTNGSKMEHIPTLSANEIKKMLEEEERYSNQLNKLSVTYWKWEANHQNLNEQNLLVNEMASTLGFFPKKDKQSLYKWLINKNGISSKDTAVFEKNCQIYYAEFKIAVTMAAKMLIDCFELRYPFVGHVMTKTTSRNLYRGENAYYSSSKPSAFRGSGGFQKEIKPLVDYLRLCESWNLFDKFDAVNKWNFSDVNYMALSQHYGLNTQMLDITSNLKVALFFACCKFDVEVNKWHPLERSDFESTDSRKHIYCSGGDSRYGILYCTPSEINEIRWNLNTDSVVYGVTIPVVYQPFLRCHSQDAYMIVAKDDTYNIRTDRYFSKHKILLNEELCNWIFNEMDKGEAVFPLKDVPDIEWAMRKVNNLTTFSPSVFQNVFKKRWGVDERNEKEVLDMLRKYGVEISENEQEIIGEKQLCDINRKYSIDKAEEGLGEVPNRSPLIIVS